MWGQARRGGGRWSLEGRFRRKPDRQPTPLRGWWGPAGFGPTRRGFSCPAPRGLRAGASPEGAGTAPVTESAAERNHRCLEQERGKDFSESLVAWSFSDSERGLVAWRVPPVGSRVRSRLAERLGQRRQLGFGSPCPGRACGTPGPAPGAFAQALAPLKELKHCQKSKAVNRQMEETWSSGEARKIQKAPEKQTGGGKFESVI